MTITKIAGQALQFDMCVYFCNLCDFVSCNNAGQYRNSSQDKMIDKPDDDIKEICKDEGHQMKYNYLRHKQKAN